MVEVDGVATQFFPSSRSYRRYEFRSIQCTLEIVIFQLQEAGDGGIAYHQTCPMYQLRWDSRAYLINHVFITGMPKSTVCEGGGDPR